jgi:hypothetical protein
MAEIRHSISSPYFVRRILGSLNGIVTGIAVVRWFFKKPEETWRRYLELIWAVIPVANIVYAWDWLKAVFLFIISIRIHFGSP